MQPIKQLDKTLRSLSDREHCVFAASDLAAAVPQCRRLGVLLSRAAKADVLRRVCKGIYFYPVPDYPAGNLLFHAAARLIPLKIRDHQRKDAEFAALLRKRIANLKTDPRMRGDFLKEMRRFLPAATVRDTLETPAWWSYLTLMVEEQCQLAIKAIQ